MDEEYDVIVVGTCLKECILSGLLYVDGLKLWKRCRGSDSPPESLGSSREYNVDMILKFVMANGLLVRVLIHNDVTKYLNFKAVDGSFVYNKGKIHKLQATDAEAPKSPLMGLFEKRRAQKFFITRLQFSKYSFCCSYSVAPKGKYIAFVSTEAETDQSEVELKPGIDLVGPVDEIFFDTYVRYELTNNQEDDNCFISTADLLYLKMMWNLDLSVELSAASAKTEG